MATQTLNTDHLCPVQVMARQGRLRSPVDASWCWTSQWPAVAGGHAADEAAPPPLLYADGRVTIRYAPFDWVNPEARVTLVGITPGPTQMACALAEAARAWQEGLPAEAALRHAKFTASFSGSVMRRNLVQMLDDIELAAALGIDSCASLFAEHAQWLHPTSTVLYPVFTRGDEPYRGSSPRISDHPVLHELATAVLAADLELAGRSIVIPLGRAAGEAVTALVRRGQVEARRVLPCLPHPSGANGHRPRQFAAIRDELRARVRRWAG
ncbi:MAG TPA: hypothetical protein VIO14_00120 [Dehalococcoidia bacterium]